MTRSLALLAGLVALAPAHADRALLIGTGDYPALAPSLRLEAPDADAHRLRDALVRAGLPARAVTLMTDSDGTAPTRAAVLAALAGLARTARPGEQLLIYFSGHGAQAPARAAGTPDGLDEIFLLRDAARWDGAIGEVPGSIRDTELAAAIAAIRRTGADVWFVADTCHAAGLMRGALPAGVRAKGVPRSALGIPDRARRHTADEAAEKSPPPSAPSGAFTGFYAAGRDALAIERRLPLGSPDARPLSQFSYALTHALEAGRMHSLRDLAIALAAADDMLGGGAPQPEFEGSLDRPVLGLTADRPRRFAVDRTDGALRLAAGREEGITPGGRFRLTDAGSGALLGTAVATLVSLGTASLATDGALPAGAIEAEPVVRLMLAGDGKALLAAIAPAAGAGAARDLVVDAMLWRPGAARICPALPPNAAPGHSRAVSLLDLPVLGQCDVVSATIRNRGARPVDLSPFYVDAAGALAALSFVDGGGVRIAPGEARRVAVRLLAEDRGGRPLPVGGERLVLLALPGTGHVPADLRGIASPHALRSDDVGSAEVDGGGALVFRWTVASLSGHRPR